MDQLTTTIVDRSQYPRLREWLLKLSDEQSSAHLRNLCTNDLFFLLVYGLGRDDADNDWCFDRCREVQESPNGHLDLWAREHYKSTIITFALTIQDILKDPDVTVGIFSHTRPIAKGFLRQIKREFEANELLKALFPDVLYQNPGKEAPKWSEDDGIIVKRKGNPKEGTVEAWGLVDGQPTSKHYKLRVYDDTVTRESVTTPEQIAKTTEAWELSDNLGSEGGRERYVGTRYHFADSYGEMMRRQVVKPRIYAATEDGTVEGTPRFMSRERLDDKRRVQGPYTFACQMLQDPVADNTQGFKESWLKYWKPDNWQAMNRYILVDAASEKKKGSDYTAMWVVGLASDQNYYVIDVLRDRLNLTERADALFKLHKKYRPMGVGYEKYGAMADVEHIRDRQARENYRFQITELGGPMPKNDRIRRLIPDFEQGRWYLPESLTRTNYEKLTRDLVFDFVEQEYKAFPVASHDDMLDALARIYEDDLKLVWPQITTERRDDYGSSGPGYSPWAA